MFKHLPIALALGGLATLPAAAQVVSGVPQAKVNVGVGAGAKIKTPPANADARARANADTQVDTKVEMPDPMVQQRATSQGKAHANVWGLANASGNSALAALGVDLSAVTTGSAVVDGDGAAIGSVSDLIVNEKTGAVVGLEVTLENGDVVEIPASKLAISGEVITTTYLAGE